MPLDKVFKNPVVEKGQAINPERPIDDMEPSHIFDQRSRRYQAEKAYRAVDQLPESPAVLIAEQVMTSPVLTLTPDTSIAEALVQFQSNGFRHVPVVSSEERLVGIVSDRDILRYLAGLTESYQRQISYNSDARIEQLMTQPVLAANVDTDVRYIARLFVERRIGAMPVAKEGQLMGIVTRSDVLGAVMRHYTLELWA
tara:strand:+ start:93339 stop:93932 length:594 start_codon:yes stop_codon:yes gene_type:complete